MRCPSNRRTGVTLLELVVAMLILGVSLTIVAMTTGRQPEPTASESADDLLQDARRQAVRSGREQRLRVRLTPEREVIPVDEARPGSRVVYAIARPDGSLVGDPELTNVVRAAAVDPVGIPR